MVKPPVFIIETRGSTGALKELSDLLPTFLDYANIPLPEGYEVDGKSLKPFLSGKVDTHRDIIYSYIGTARMVRDSQWLIEGLDPLAGHPVGRMYYCGDNRSAKGYKEVTDSQSQEVSEARKRLMAYLGTIPYLDPENPEHTRRINRYIKGNVFPHRINVKK